MTLPSFTVELLTSTNSTYPFDGLFTLDDSLLDGDDVLTTDNIWVDITTYVQGFEITRGRQRNIDQFLAGTLALDLNNNNRYFDPTNTLSPFNGNILPLRQIRVKWNINGVAYPLFLGFAQDWSVGYNNTERGSTTTVYCADAFSIFANQELATIIANYSGDTSGQRVTRVLNRPEVAVTASTVPRNIDTGVAIFGLTTLGVNVLQYLQLCAISETGNIFIKADGTIRFIGRDAMPGDPVCSISDGATANTGADAIGISPMIRYEDIDQLFNVDLLYTQVSTSGTSGIVQTADSVDGEAAYQIRPLDRTGQLVLSNAEMLSQAQWLVAQFSVPELRLHDAQINVLALDQGGGYTERIALASLDLTSRVQVLRTPSTGAGNPATINLQGVVDGLGFRWNAESGEFRADVICAEATNLFGFILDSDLDGILDDNALAF